MSSAAHGGLISPAEGSFRWVRPRRWARSARAIVWRDYLITRSYRLAFATDLIFAFANVAIYYYISRTIRGAPQINLRGAPSYFAYAIPGISLMIVAQAAALGLGRRLREEQLSGTLELLAAQPVDSADVALGLAGFPFLFAMLRAGLYFGFAVAVFGLGASGADAAGFAIVFVLTGAVMVALGIAVGAIVLVFKRGETLGPLLMLTLGLAGGAYFPTGLLPAFLKPLVDVIPMRFAFDGLRSALYGGGWAHDALALAAIGAAALPLSLLAFDRALRHGRSRGSLAQY